MNKYFVIVFGENSYFKYRLKDIMLNSFNGFVNDQYAFMGINYYFPIVLEDGVYYINDKNNDWQFTLNGEKVTEKQSIKHGDYILISSRGIDLSMLIFAYNQSTIDSKIYKLRNNSITNIGSFQKMNIVLNYSTSIAEKQAVISLDNKGNAFLVDSDSETGVYVNKNKVMHHQLENGDSIFIMGTTIVYYDNCLIMSSGIKTSGLMSKSDMEFLVPVENIKENLYVRTPRIQKSLERGVIEIDPPTPKQKLKEVPFILAAGPSITMSFAMLASLGVTISNVLRGGNWTSIITSGVMAMSMLLGAVFWPKLSRNYAKKQAIANEKHRKKRYLDYLSKKNKEIKNLYKRNTSIWNEILYPDIPDLLKIVLEQDSRLWERSVNDEDFLELRLGTGNKPFEVDIITKKKSFELEDDFLKDEGYKVALRYKNLIDIPITISLMQHHVVGVVGEYQQMAKTMIVNLTTMYAPEDVKIVLIYNHYQEDSLNCFNDLPHMWSNDRESRFVATTEMEVHSLFVKMDELIQAREATLGKNDIRVPHFVFLVFDQRLIDNIPFKKSILDVQNNIGVSAVFYGERFVRGKRLVSEHR